MAAQELPRFEAQVVTREIKFGYQLIAVDLNGDGKKDLDGEQWKRVVIEDKMENGHGLAVGDLNGDGRDEIVSGFRGKGFQLSIYQATDAKGEHWNKIVLDDGGIAAADCVIEDFDGDGKPDIAAIGASTGNVKLYKNLGK